MSSEKIRNWDRTQSWMPEAIYQPTNEEEIVELIGRAGEENKQIRPIGRALSWSDIIDIPAMTIRLDNMAEVLEVDMDDCRVRLQAGAQLKHINDVLAGYGLPSIILARLHSTQQQDMSPPARMAPARRPKYCQPISIKCA